MEAQFDSVVGQLRAFKNSHLSHSTKSENSASNRTVDHKVYPINRILADAGLELLPPLEAEEWTNFQKCITIVYDGKKEKSGVHPRLKQILATCVSHVDCQIEIIHEGTYEDDELLQREPDFVAVLKSRDKLRPVISLSSIVGALEAKVQSAMAKAISQAMGYASSQMLEIFEIGGLLALDSQKRVICFGSDGVALNIGLVSVKDGNVLFRDSGKTTVELWTTSNEAPLVEPMGVRILRSFLTATPVHFVPTFNPRQQIDLPGGDYIRLEYVLGRGGSATVFCAETRTGPIALKTPRYGKFTVSSQVSFARELSVLRQFARLSVDAAASLPHLLYTYLPEGHSHFIALAEVGQPLHHAVKIPIVQRRLYLGEMRCSLQSALQAAHSLGILHTDIRPHNVIVMATGRVYKFVLIDWGLSIAMGSAVSVSERQDVDFLPTHVLCSEGPVLYLPTHDFETLEYVLHVFVKSPPYLVPSWNGYAYVDIPHLRTAALDELPW